MDKPWTLVQGSQLSVYDALTYLDLTHLVGLMYRQYGYKDYNNNNDTYPTRTNTLNKKAIHADITICQYYHKWYNQCNQYTYNLL